MRPYEHVRDGLTRGSLNFRRLDAAQLVKHAFGLRTVVQAGAKHAGKKPTLFYLYAEPVSWPSGIEIEDAILAMHREEISLFADLVTDAEVAFVPRSYSELLATWTDALDQGVRGHAAALLASFDLCADRAGK